MVFHNFYLVQSWIHCPTCFTDIWENSTADKFIKAVKVNPYPERKVEELFLALSSAYCLIRCNSEKLKCKCFEIRALLLCKSRKILSLVELTITWLINMWKTYHSKASAFHLLLNEVSFFFVQHSSYMFVFSWRLNTLVLTL